MYPKDHAEPSLTPLIRVTVASSRSRPRPGPRRCCLGPRARSRARPGPLPGAVPRLHHRDHRVGPRHHPGGGVQRRGKRGEAPAGMARIGAPGRAGDAKRRGARCVPMSDFSVSGISGLCFLLELRLHALGPISRFDFRRLLAGRPLSLCLAFCSRGAALSSSR